MNKIQQAYEMGVRVRYKGWLKWEWIKKHSETEVIDESGKVWDGGWAFDNNPEKWEIFTEDAHILLEPTEIKSKIENHINQIQELLKQL
jgi:hypothetical protein